MPEPQPTPTSEPAGQTPPAGTTEPTETNFNWNDFIEPDGTLKDGWKAGLPEELQGELSLDTFKTFPESIHQTVSAQKMIGKGKIAIPTEKSSQAEWDAFYAAGGRPKTADDYLYEPPKDLELVDLSPDSIAPIFNDLHKAGASQKVVDVAMGHFHRYIKGLENEAVKAEEEAFQEAEKKIRESGADIEADKHAANMLIAENFPNEEFKTNLLEIVNDHELRPYLFSFLANIQRKYFDQHSGMPAGEGGVTGDTPATMRARADELGSNPEYLNGTMKNQNPAAYNRLTKEITDLYNKADEIERQQKQRTG